MCFEPPGKGEAVTFVVAYPLTDRTNLKRISCQMLDYLVEQMPTIECLFTLLDAHARAGRRVGACGDNKRRVLEACRVKLLTMMAKYVCRSP